MDIIDNKSFLIIQNNNAENNEIDFRLHVSRSCLSYSQPYKITNAVDLLRKYLEWDFIGTNCLIELVGFVLFLSFFCEERGHCAVFPWKIYLGGNVLRVLYGFNGFYAAVLIVCFFFLDWRVLVQSGLTFGQGGRFERRLLDIDKDRMSCKAKLW